jgi:N-acetylmuramoyl-L-alanine amidase
MIQKLILCMTMSIPLVVNSEALACDRGMFVIAVDPGHARTSPGTLSARGIPEEKFNENLAQFLVGELIKIGFRDAFLTNENGSSISLMDRADLANRRNANLFLSIHHDSVQPRYLSTWTYGGRRLSYSDAFSGYSLFFSEKNGDPKGSIVFARLLGSEFRSHCFAPTLHHAEKIKGENRELVDEERGIYKFDDLVVLKLTKMPAVLIESGLIVNRADEILLRNPVYQKMLVLSITQAVVKFCEGESRDAGINQSCPRISASRVDE